MCRVLVDPVCDDPDLRDHRNIVAPMTTDGFNLYDGLANIEKNIRFKWC